MSTKSPVHSEQYPASYYFATAKELHQSPRLEGVFDVDVCVVGGGFSGINTAIELAQKGRLPDAKNIFYAQAYAGHGVNATHMAAKLIAEAISTQAERFDIFAQIPHMTFPGGPYLRSPLLAMGMLYHRFRDIF